MTRFPAALCTTEALQKWLETPESGRYRTPATAVPPNGFPLGGLAGCSGGSTVEPGPAAAATAAVVCELSAVGSGVTLPGAPTLLAPVVSAVSAVVAGVVEVWAAERADTELEELLGVEAGAVSAAPSAATAVAEDGELKAVPSIPAITASPAAPAASAARRARARLRA
jgi:hypothetical protein